MVIFASPGTGKTEFLKSKQRSDYYDWDEVAQQLVGISDPQEWDAYLQGLDGRGNWDLDMAVFDVCRDGILFTGRKNLLAYSVVAIIRRSAEEMFRTISGYYGNRSNVIREWSIERCAEKIEEYGRIAYRNSIPVTVLEDGMFLSNIKQLNLMEA